MRFAVILHAAAILVGCAAQEQEPARDPNPLVTFSGPTMGTQYTVKIVGLSDRDAADQVHQAIEQRLNKLDSLLSTYDHASDVSEFNQSESRQWRHCSVEMAEVIAEALHVGQVTEGAFDITCGPLVDLWGFGPDRRTAERIPTEDQIADAKGRIGLDKLEYQLEPPSVRKGVPNLRIDLSGVAKGYAVDQIALLLRHARIENFMVDVGGEVRAQGVNAEGVPWRIGIEAPLPGVRSVRRVIAVADTGLATSGDYRNYFEEAGRRYSHIIDPRTGQPIQHRLVSVSVLDPSCARADAFATGLMVLGPQEGYRIATEHKLAILMIVKTDAGFFERMTPEFEEATRPLGDATPPAHGNAEESP
ncbi:MAG: FAD:protein FMN transferase [Patescibacteria group bacterium]|nr:FAD:protein FMN transferase [Patescibacteria group bacterium]